MSYEYITVQSIQYGTIFSAIEIVSDTGVIYIVNKGAQIVYDKTEFDKLYRIVGG